MMYLNILFTLVFFLVSGCGVIKSNEDILLGMYNISEVGEIKFDSTKYVRMRNISCSPIMFELYQDTLKQKEGVVLLKAGVNFIDNLGDGESLEFRVDGEYYQFKAVSDSTQHSDIYLGSAVVNYSYKKYLVSTDFVKSVGGAEELLVRVSLLSGAFVDGRCSPQKREHLKGVSAGKVSDSHLVLGNMVAGTLGFQEFVRLSNSVAW